MAFNFRHGKAAIFKLSDTGGSTVTFSSGFDDSNLNRTVDMAEITAFGDNDKTYLAGLRDTTISLSGHFTSTQQAALNGLLGHSTSSTFTYQPEGGTAGYRKFTGAAFVTSLSVGAPVGDKISMSVDLQVTGAVTSTTV